MTGDGILPPPEGPGRGAKKRILFLIGQLGYGGSEKQRERFARGVLKPADLPAEVWINKPNAGDGSSDKLHIKF